MITIHCAENPGCTKPVTALQPGIRKPQAIATNNNKCIINILHHPPELRSSSALVKQKTRNGLGMVLNDQLCSIAGVGDLYTIGFDGVNVLGMKSLFQAQECEEEEDSLHKWLY